MPRSSSTLSLSLAARPAIAQLGLGVHETKRRETFTRQGLWALHLYFWTGSFSFDGHNYPVRPHHVGLTPPDRPITWHFPTGKCSHYFVHFRLADSSQSRYELPVSQPLGSLFTAVNRRVEKCIATFNYHRQHGEVILWDILWILATETEKKQARVLKVLPGPLETALGIIDSEIAQPLNAGTVAERIGCSYSQLNQLFRTHLQTTLGKYLARQRLERALHLLRDSNIPISVVAGMVGIPNIQHFNKFMHRHMGTSPRMIRADGTLLPD